MVRDPQGTLVGLRGSSGAMSYYQLDGQGSVIGLTDPAGTRVAEYTYDPYGSHHTAARPGGGTPPPANPFRYIGGYLDANTGLYKLGIRYYNPDLGRFTQPDPTGRDKYAYAYSNCDPVNYTDPTGEFGLPHYGEDCGRKFAGVVTFGLTSAVLYRDWSKLNRLSRTAGGWSALVGVVDLFTWSYECRWKGDGPRKPRCCMDPDDFQ